MSRRGTQDGGERRRELRARESLLHADGLLRPRVDLERERVAEIQRARMLAAMVDLTRERGAERVTVAHVVARAGVSRRTFYELFDDREACLLAALDEALRRVEAAVVPAYKRERGWSARVGAGLTAMLECFDADPAGAALCVVDSLAAGPEALERRARVVDALVSAVDRGRREPGAPAGLNRVTAEGVAGAVLGVLYTRLREPSPKPLMPLRGQLMSMIVLPYLGPRAAAGELARRAPRSRQKARAREDPLKRLDMRLTYRTMRVLAAVAAQPGLNNRQIARDAGVADQGQMSKLLARLEGLGLIANNGESQVRGEPNMWRLTPRGEELEQAIRAREEHASH
ncbi:MAG TPA: TetR family transcriptional regulator [Solirubrobacteraceae bacterium]|nr:TetR family transcriptional regulator [Solirubrobacteraceae bacterium]